MSKKPYYLTTAIAYTSGKPHIGNTYEIVLADAIVRYKRFQGYDVRFQTGTDEHGQKIELKAQEAGITPKEFVDGVSTEIKRIFQGNSSSLFSYIYPVYGFSECVIIFDTYIIYIRYFFLIIHSIPHFRVVY
jgi:methionyl-tRNA synthetase